MSNQYPLAEASRLYGDQCAYRNAQNQVTYAELSQKVTERANCLVEMGIQPLDRIAWSPRNDYPTLVDLWAILQVGAVACPVSYRFPQARQRELAEQLQAKWLPDLRSLGPAKQISHSIDLFAPATIVLSSGSTGTPKAVVHSLNAHVASARGAATRIPLAAGDCWLWALPTFHVGGLSIPFRCAEAGATVYGVHSNDLSLRELLQDSQATHVSLVPTQLRRLLDSQTDLGHIKAALVGGMAVPPSLLQRAIDQGIPVHTTYGLTETASQVTTTFACRTPTESSGETLPFRELTIGSHDEILVRGETLCLGYDVAGEITSVTDELGWFHTRDRGRLTQDGELCFLGRMDNMFVSGGENIHPETIERELLSFPEIRQAIVVAQQDTEFGARPVAFVDTDKIDEDRWNAELRNRLAGFSIPKEYLIWPTDAELAIKPDRIRLAKLASEA